MKNLVPAFRAGYFRADNEFVHAKRTRSGNINEGRQTLPHKYRSCNDDDGDEEAGGDDVELFTSALLICIRDNALLFVEKRSPVPPHVGDFTCGHAARTGASAPAIINRAPRSFVGRID